MTTRPPAVSVVLPFLNAERFLDEAIASVLAQTHASWELLLVDDGSSDASPRIARAYAERDPRIACLGHPGRGRRGAFASRLLAARRARAPLLALLDHDDVWQPAYLERHLSFWRRMRSRAPSLALSYGPARYWWPDGGGAGLPSLQPMPWPSARLFAPGELLRNFLSGGYQTTPFPSCALIRRGALLKLARFAGAARRCRSLEDQFLWWGSAMRWPAAVHTGAWVRYRRAPRPKARAAGDERVFLEAIRRELSRRVPGHPLLRDGGLSGRITGGRFFHERIPAALRTSGRDGRTRRPPRPS